MQIVGKILTNTAKKLWTLIGGTTAALAGLIAIITFFSPPTMSTLEGFTADLCQPETRKNEQIVRFIKDAQSFATQRVYISKLRLENRSCTNSKKEASEIDNFGATENTFMFYFPTLDYISPDLGDPDETGVYLSVPVGGVSKNLEMEQDEGGAYRLSGPVLVEFTSRNQGEGDIYITLHPTRLTGEEARAYYCTRDREKSSFPMNLFAC